MAPRRQNLTALLAVLAGWGIAIGLMVLPLAFLHGPDGYFHVRLAAMMQEHGLFLDQFPWATESLWSERYFDKEWLFHVLLVPFLRFGPITGAHLVVVLLNLLIAVAFWYALRGLGHARPAWVVALLPFGGMTLFWDRLILCRPHLLSIALLFLCLGAICRRRYLLLGLLSFLYALSYTGHWQLLGIVFLADLLFLLLDDDGRRRPALRWRTWPLLLPTAIGMALGELAHPQFPDNLIGLYVQNVQVVWEYWQGGGEAELFAMRPAEMRPPSLTDFAQLTPALIGSFVVIVVAWRSRWRPPRHLLLLALLTGLYLFMTLRSLRFAEYFIGTAGLFAGLGWHYLELGRRLREQRLAAPATVAAAILAAVVLWVCLDHLVLPGFADANQPLRCNHVLYGPAATWVDRAGQPDDIVWATSWSDNPVLWFGAPRQRYLVFLDSYFMYARSPERFRLWAALRRGHVEHPATVIRDVFGARFVFSQDAPAFAPFLRQLEEDPSVKLLLRDPQGNRVYDLRPAGP